MLRFFRNYFFVLAGNATASILSFVISILLSRAMGLEGFGAYSLFFTVLTLVWQIPAFLDSSYVRYARTAGPDGPAVYLRVNLVYKLRASGLILVLAAPLGWALARWVVPGKAGAAVLALGVAGGAGLTFLTSLTSYFQAGENFIGYAAGNIAYYLAVLAVLGGLAVFGPLTAIEVAAAFVGMSAALGGAALFYLARRVRPLRPLSRSAADRMLTLGRWILPTVILLVVLQRLDMMVVGHYFSGTQLGVYAVASRFLSALGIFLNAAGSLYLTKSAAAPGSPAALRSYARESLFLTALILAAIAVLVLFAADLLKIFFGSRYIGAVPALRAVLLGSAPRVLGLPLSYLLYALDDSFSNFAAMTLCLGANLALNLLLTPRIGLTGPGWALGAGYALYLAYLVFAVFVLPRHRARLAALARSRS